MFQMTNMFWNSKFADVRTAERFVFFFTTQIFPLGTEFKNWIYVGIHLTVEFTTKGQFQKFNGETSYVCFKIELPLVSNIHLNCIIYVMHKGLLLFETQNQFQP